MSFTIDFDSLRAGYLALLMVSSGADVTVRVPRRWPLMSGGMIMCSFFSNQVFAGGQASVEYSRMESAYETLHSMSPNTIYVERAFAVQDRSVMRDFVNFFRGKAYRDIFTDDGAAPRYGDGCSLAGGKVLKRAPSFRINYSRHLVSLLRTCAQKGARVVWVDDDSLLVDPQKDNDGGSPRLILYQVEGGNAPAPYNTMYLPGDVWLFNRCSVSYVLAPGGVDVCGVIGQCFDGCRMTPGCLREVVQVPGECLQMPLEAWAEAMDMLPGLCAEYGLRPVDVGSMRLDGSEFQFQPSMADVVGYADYWFDTVKRMEIDVNVFRNAVFDYGTHIEQIVDDTYNLYPEYRKGPLAFDAAVARWRAGELDL